MQTSSNLSVTDIFDSYQLFLPFSKTPSSPLSSSNPSLTTSILSVPILDDECLESWIGNGRSCANGKERRKEVELDVVWTWVNGSDPLWHHQYHHYSTEATMPRGWGSPLKHYRNKDELRLAGFPIHADDVEAHAALICLV